MVIHRRIEPPRMDTYTKEGAFVFVSKFHTEEERKDNIRMAQFLAEKTGDVIYVLPIIQPTQKNAERLRKEYFPEGVKKNKNPDFYFKGRFVDGKSMMGIKESDIKTVKRKIQKRLKEAFSQADDAILETPINIPFNHIEDAIWGYINSSKHQHIVYVKYGSEFRALQK